MHQKTAVMTPKHTSKPDFKPTNQLTLNMTDFTVGEIRNAVASVGNKKAPGEEGIKREIYESAFDMLPNYITALYNGCLQSFPKELEKSQPDPHNRTWERKQQRSIEVSHNKAVQCRWESFGESLNKQNKLTCFTRLYERPPVRFYVSKRHIRHDHGNKGIHQGRPSSRRNYSSNMLRRKWCF